jgi:hypothetical protein
VFQGRLRDAHKRLHALQILLDRIAEQIRARQPIYLVSARDIYMLSFSTHLRRKGRYWTSRG